MRHRYVCPVRWADLDLLGHVNNVRYVDYLQEARVDLLRAHRWSGDDGAAGEALAEGIVVVRHEVSYRAPLHFDLEPVLIECWVTELRAGSFTMAYEVFREDPASGERTVFVEASTVLAPFRFDAERPRRLTKEERAALATYVEPVDTPPVRAARAPVAIPPTPDGHYPVHVRFSDVDVYRHVNNVVYFEYFQEARILLFAHLGRDAPGAEQVSVVVAQTDVDYVAPITLRQAPYDCWSQVTRMGRTSMTIESQILDGEQVLASARVVLVFFDKTTERPAEPAAWLRERFGARLSDD